MQRRNRSNRPGIIGLLLLILVLATVLGYYLRLGDPRFQPRAGTQDTVPAGTEAVDWEKLDQLRDYVIDNYNGPVVNRTLLEGALKGMVASLGQGGGEYFNAREYPEVQDRAGMTHGTGIHLGTSDGSLLVISADPGSEGERAGVLPGDIIIRINGRTYSGDELERAKNLMVSNDNGHVELDLLRGSRAIETRVRLRRMKEPKVLSGIDGEIGILRLPSFYSDVSQDFSEALEDLSRQGIQGLVLDLRNTPTGSLSEGVRIAALFLEEGETVVSLRDTRNKIRDFISQSGAYRDLPLVLLINGQTEGTAEFVAGALGQREGVTLIGEPTRGEGRVFSYIDLPDGEGIKLASGYLLLPDGGEIHEQSIEPDIAITMDPKNSNDLSSLGDRQKIRALNLLKLQLEERR